MDTPRTTRGTAPVNYSQTKVIGARDTASPAPNPYGTNKQGGPSFKTGIPAHLRLDGYAAQGPPVDNRRFPPTGPPGPYPLYHAPPGQWKWNPAATHPVSQGKYTTYPSRMQTGVSSLMQPIVITGGPQNGLVQGFATAAVGTPSGTSTPLGGGPSGTPEVFSRTGRPMRRTVNYAEDNASSDDDDNSGEEAASKQYAQQMAQRKREQQEKEKQEGWSWLGERPPGERVSSRQVNRAPPDYRRYPERLPVPEYELEKEAYRPCLLVPIRVELDTEHHRIRDCFTWNLNERFITPIHFAEQLCKDLGISENTFAPQIANMITQQAEEYQGLLEIDAEEEEQEDEEVDGDDEGNEEADGEEEDQEEDENQDDEEEDVEQDEEEEREPERPVKRQRMEGDARPSKGKSVKYEEIEPDCRVIVNLDLQIYTYNLRDRIEWDLASTLTPEQFTTHYCAEIGLTGEAHSIIAHAIHEELLKHKKDALEQGLLMPGAGMDYGDGRSRREGPRKLRGIWREWNEREEFGPVLVELTLDEIEKKEQERVRAARRMRRDTAKFSSANVRYRNR